MTEFCTTGLLWGSLLILIGLITLINVIFNVHIPIFRILIATFFIYLGLRMLTETSTTQRYYYSSCSSKQGICNEKNVMEYNVVFGKQVIDLTTQDIPNQNIVIAIDTSFGESLVLIDTTKPIRIEASASFGSIELPNNSHISFGHHTCQTSTYKEASEAMHIKVKVAFGKCVIIDKNKYQRPMDENKDNHEQKI